MSLESTNPDRQLVLPAEPPTVHRSQGVLTYVTSTEYPRWKIVGTQHLVETCKALFSGAISQKWDHVSFPAVESTFDDLRMLVARFQITIWCKEDYGRFEKVRAEAQRWREAPDEALVMPDTFKGELAPYQKAGVRFLLSARRALLADSTGLGKTVECLAYAAYCDQWPVIVVCQPHVLSHWREKTQEFLKIEEKRYDVKAPFVYAVLRGAAKARRIPLAHVYILHYLTLKSWVDGLMLTKPKIVIFDECQELRHPGTHKHNACTRLAEAAQHVIGASATPLYNHGVEIFNVLNVLNRGCLGTKNDFTSRWCGWSGVVDDPAALGQSLIDRNLMLRRRKEDVMSELPAKRRCVEPIDSDNKLFAELVKEAIAKAKQAELIANPFERAQLENEALAHLRKATGIAKVPAVVAFLTGLLEAGETVICFAHHRAVHDALCEALAHFKPARITGEETMDMKDESKRAFMDGETNYIQIALRAATGIDGLQHRGKCVVFAELDWSPAVMSQGEDRLHRRGQRDSVLAYYLVTDVGTDPGMLDTLSLKESQFLGIMQDKAQTQEDHEEAQSAKKRHMASILEKLRRM